MQQLITISDHKLPIIEYQSKRVITTDMLAQGYGTDTKSISKNFNRNKNRFIEGKHYFKIEGDELRSLINHSSLRGVVNKHTNHIYLWTERGASRHAKMLETDQAWDWFEALEDSYFIECEKKLPTIANNDKLADYRSAKARELNAKALEIQMRNTLQIFELLPNLSDSSRQQIMAQLINPIAGTEVFTMPVIEEKHYSATEIGEMFGVSAQKIGRISTELSLKQPQYGEYRLSKASHCDKQVETWVYNQHGINAFAMYFEEAIAV